VNLTTILAELYRRLRYPSAPPAGTTTRLTGLINEVINDMCSLPGMDRLRDDTLIVTALANQSRTGLPPSVARIMGIVDRTNNVKLQQVPLAELRGTDPARAFTGGYPLRYSVVGNQAVQIQPAVTGSGLWVASSAAGDTTQKAYVESITLGGYPNPIVTAGTALNGLTRVAIGARTDHIDVTRFYLDLPAVGFVSLYDAAVAGNELARLPIAQTWSRYLAVEWWPIQTQDVTEYADVQRKMYDLVNGTDEPLIPEDFHDVIIQGVLMREYVMLDDSRVGITRLGFEKGCNDLSSWVMNDGDRIASLRPYPQRWSRLGGNYPSERSIYG
jgi:hypothetical protein